MASIEVGSGWKRILIFLNGESVPVNYWQELIPGALIIAADGGVRALKQRSLFPQVLLGDFDSLEEGELAQLEPYILEVRNFPAEKDQTDAELALEYALSSGVKEIVLIGGLGKRIDHALANLMLLVKIDSQGKRGRMLNRESEIFLVPGEIQLVREPGQLISLLPLTDVEGVEVEGCQYPLNGDSLRVGETRGISNAFIQNIVRIRKKTGLLLAILPHSN